MRCRLWIGLAVMCLLLSVSCTDRGNAKIELTLADAPEGSMVVVSRLAVNTLEVMDTLYTVNREVSFSTELEKNSPEFIYMTFGNTTLAAILSPGETLDIRTDYPHGENVHITGSDEALRMYEVDNMIRDFNVRFTGLLDRYEDLLASGKQQAASETGKELTELFLQYRKDAIKFVYAHPSSLSLLPILYQTTPNGIEVFSASTDMLLFRRVYDSLYKVYPSSAYVAALADEVQRREDRLQMEQLLTDVEEVDFPEILLRDVDGNKRSLSGLKGKVIALIFWDPSSVEQRIFNTELREVYDRYHRRGFEIYQVGLTTDKTGWAMQVKEQKNPWINVCEPFTDNSFARLYNVDEVPTIYMINRDGSIVSKNIFDRGRFEEEIVRLLSE